MGAWPGDRGQGIVVRVPSVLALTRSRVPESETDSFLVDARATLTLLRAAPGFRRGHVGRCTDDPTLWVLCTEWAGVGAYRRALSSYAVKIVAMPLLARALDEPGAYEVLESVAADVAPPPPNDR